MDKKKLDDLFFYLFLSVILGGRIGYVIFYNLDFYYQVTDGFNFTEVSQSLSITLPKPKSYSTIESEGNTSLVVDDDKLGYAQDSKGNRQAITYQGEHTSLDMWSSEQGSWDFLAAENIDGINSVIWKFKDRFSEYDQFWLSLHDENWEF